MPRPTISPAFNWLRFETAVLDVFTEALSRLASEPVLTQGEESLNLRLFRLCKQVHHEQMRANKSMPFFILFDSTNQPEPDDEVRAARLRKRPDFGCALTNPQSADVEGSQVLYSIECKRLGNAIGKWVFTSNYSRHGILRFCQAGHAYSKGTESAAMIGYVQNMADVDLLREVNTHAAVCGVPSLSLAAKGWAARAVTRLMQGPLQREFDDRPLQLTHLWLDLRHVTFVEASPAAPPPSSRRRSQRRKGSKASAPRRRPSRRS